MSQKKSQEVIAHHHSTTDAPPVLRCVCAEQQWILEAFLDSESFTTLSPRNGRELG